MVVRDHECLPYLTSIPELVTHIFDFLCCNKYDLWSCCLVNKQWCCIVSPILWKNPSFSCAKSLKAFQRTILENPDVARLVKVLNTDIYRRREVHPLTELIACLPSLERVRFCASHYERILSDKRGDFSFSNLKEIQFLEITPKDLGWRSLITILNNSPRLENLGLLINGDLHLTLNAIPMDFPCLKALSSLELQYYPQTASADFFRNFFSFMPNLKRLKLYSFFISADIVKVISQNCHHLEVLHLISAFMPDDVAAHKIIEYISTNQFGQNLRELWLNLVNYTQYIGALDIPNELMHRFCDTLSHVGELQLCGITFNHGATGYLAQKISQNLRSFKLSKIYCRDIQEIFSTKVWETLFQRCGDRLEHLTLEYLELPPNIGEIIARRCVSLRSICFRYTTILDDSILDFTEALSKKLRHLELRNTNLSTNGLSYVLKYCQHLEHLDVGDRLTKPAISEHLFREFTHQCDWNLRYLCFVDCCITNSLLECIANACWNLNTLKLTNQTGLSDDGIERIMKQCHRLESLHILQERQIGSGLTAETITKITQEFIRP